MSKKQRVNQYQIDVNDLAEFKSSLQSNEHEFKIVYNGLELVSRNASTQDDYKNFDKIYSRVENLAPPNQLIVYVFPVPKSPNCKKYLIVDSTQQGLQGIESDTPLPSSKSSYDDKLTIQKLQMEKEALIKELAQEKEKTTTVGGIFQQIGAGLGTVVGAIAKEKMTVPQQLAGAPSCTPEQLEFIQFVEQNFAENAPQGKISDQDALFEIIKVCATNKNLLAICFELAQADEKKLKSISNSIKNYEEYQSQRTNRTNQN